MAIQCFLELLTGPTQAPVESVFSKCLFMAVLPQIGTKIFTAARDRVSGYGVVSVEGLEYHEVDDSWIITCSTEVDGPWKRDGWFEDFATEHPEYPGS